MDTIALFTFESCMNDILSVIYEIVDNDFNKLDWLNEYPESIFVYYIFPSLGKLLALKLEPYATKE